MSAPTITIKGGDDTVRKSAFDNVRTACPTCTVFCNLEPDDDGLVSVSIAGGDAAERSSLYNRVRTALINTAGIGGIYREEAQPDTPQPVNDGDLMTRLGMDAQKWAVEFGQRFDMATVRLDPERPSKGWVDKADLIGWFANAIMAGYDRGREQGWKEERDGTSTLSHIRGDIKLRGSGDAQIDPTKVSFRADEVSYGGGGGGRQSGSTMREHCAEAQSEAEVVTHRHHLGDPCVHCGASHDDVATGPCPCRLSWFGRIVSPRKIATLLIPRIDSDGHDLAAEHAALQVELIGLFGGYAATAATGGWRDGLTIYRDELTRYDIAVKAFDTTVERDLQRVAERMARACHQDCIMLVLPDGQAIGVDAAGGVR